jgi:hypothetical protein
MHGGCTSGLSETAREVRSDPEMLGVGLADRGRMFREVPRHCHASTVEISSDLRIAFYASISLFCALLCFQLGQTCNNHRLWTNLIGKSCVCCNKTGR